MPNLQGGKGEGENGADDAGEGEHVVGCVQGGDAVGPLEDIFRSFLPQKFCFIPEVLWSLTRLFMESVTHLALRLLSFSL